MEMTGDEMEAGRGESYEVFFLSCPCARSRSGSDWGRLEPWAKPGGNRNPDPSLKGVLGAAGPRPCGALRASPGPLLVPEL